MKKALTILVAAMIGTAAFGQAPVVFTGTGSNATVNSFIARGLVYPNNAATVFWFNYDYNATNLTMSTATNSAGANTTTNLVTATLTPLLDSVRVWFQVVASNANGTTFGLIDDSVTSPTTFQWVGPDFLNVNIFEPQGSRPAYQLAPAIRQLAAAGVDLRNTIFQPGTTKANTNFIGGAEANVKIYGATGNSFTNDQPAIQAAIDYVQDTGGGTVLFPPGVYTVTAQLLVTNPYVALVGAGAGASIINVNAEIGDVVKFNNVSWGRIQDLQVTFGTSNSTAGAGIVFRHCQLMAIDRVRVNNFFGGIKLVSCLSTRLEKVETDVTGSGWAALRTGSYGLCLAEETGLGGWNYNSGIDVVNCGFRGEPSSSGWLNSGMLIQSVDGIQVVNTTCADAAIGLYANPVTSTSPLDLIQFANGGFDTCSNLGVSFFATSAYTGPMGGNFFSSDYFYNSPTHFSFNIPTTAPGFGMDNCNFEFSTNDAVILNAGYGNQIANCRFTDQRSPNWCIHVSGPVTNCMISGILYRKKTTEQAAGVVRLESGAISNLVSGVLNGGSATNVSDGGTANKIDWGSIQ